MFIASQIRLTSAGILLRRALMILTKCPSRTERVFVPRDVERGFSVRRQSGNSNCSAWPTQDWVISGMSQQRTSVASCARLWDTWAISSQFIRVIGLTVELPVHWMQLSTTPLMSAVAVSIQQGADF